MTSFDLIWRLIQLLLKDANMENNIDKKIN